MAKITFIEEKPDKLLKGLGKAKVIDNYDFGKSRIINNGSPNLLVTFLSKETKEDGVLLSEVTKLKIQPVDQTQDLRQSISQAIPIGQDISNHYVHIEDTPKATTVATTNLNQTIASYDIVTAFNYLSEDYDSSLAAVSEEELIPVLQRKTKRDFVNYRQNKQLPPINFSPEARRFQNFVIPNAGPNVKKDLNAEDILSQRPYYNEIKITNKVTNKFTNFINEIGVFDPMLNAYLEAPKTKIDFNVQLAQNARSMTLEAFNLLDWVNSPGFTIPDNVYPLDPDSVNASAMISNYKKYLFAGYVRSLSKGNFRSFEEIYNNHVCYKEDFVYSVDKYRDVVIEPKAQTFYIPAVDDTSIFNDTQIKYGQAYVYKCQAHYIIVGNKYRYENLKFDTDPEGNQYATVDVINVPSVVVVPFEMFQERLVTLMPPPLFPQVKFVTENNSQNQIQIYLSPTKGYKFDEFVEILPEDRNQSFQMEQNSMSRGSVIRFQTFPDSGLYQIFKCDTPPKSYADFADKKLTEIRMPYQSNSALFNDLVVPNTKYYYLFRKINAKGLVSNPTAIYEVELLKDADESRIVVTEYDFPKKILSQDSRRFKSLFQITPAQDQVFFDEEQTVLWDKSTMQGTIDNLNLGTASKAVWGKRFKIRIKSKTSGKIIDYNVSFKLTKNKTEEDF